MIVVRPVVVLSVVAMAGLSPQDSSFTVSTTDPAYRASGFLGNGAFSLITTPLGTSPAPSFAAGVYDAAPGDVPRIAELPAWSAVDVWNGRGWLNQVAPDTAALKDYRQTLDMQNGLLETSYRWVADAREMPIAVESFVSRADARLAVIRVSATSTRGGPVAFRFPLDQRPPPQRVALARLETSDPKWTLNQVWYPGHVTASVLEAGKDRLYLDGRTDGRGTGVAMTAIPAWPGEHPDSIRVEHTRSGVAIVAWFTASPGKPLTVYKYVGIASTRHVAEASASASATRGYDDALARSRDAWHDLWRSDIEIAGDPELQRVVHAMLFQLMSSVRAGSAQSLPPMGLSSGGYYGHVFWDADTWMFPALLALHPELARSMVDFRFHALSGARKRAVAHGFRGAMYPWESDETGNETVPRFAAQNGDFEIHVTGDVARAQWLYYLATADSAWLADTGYVVLAATADFWASRVSYDTATRSYGIPHVVSVDEGLIGVGNDVYTNAVALVNLRDAIAAARAVGKTPHPQWGRVASGFYVPFYSGRQYHPPYAGAPDTLHGGVAPLLVYPLELPMSRESEEHDLEAAVRALYKEGPGAMMTVTLYPVVAAALGKRALFDSLVPDTYRGYLRPPFDVLAETPRTQGVDFVTGAGGFLQQVQYGYTGLRWGRSGLDRVATPMLPSKVTRLTLRGVHDRHRVVDVVVEGDSVSIRVR
jgi:trehalose/maltose hydrolase-like predicted phosphorylase